MIRILKIAKLELNSLFYSPVAWLALAIFMVQSGMSFLSMFGSFQEALSMGIPVNKLTFSLFPGLNGLFDTVQQNLYLYVPLLKSFLCTHPDIIACSKLYIRMCAETICLARIFKNKFDLLAYWQTQGMYKKCKLY